MLDMVPRPIFVAGVLALGVAAFFYIQKPVTVCDLQVDVFKEAQAGQVFPKKIKNIIRPPVYSKHVQVCKEGNSPGACFELFSFMKKFVRDLASAPTECLPNFGEIGEVKRVLSESSQMLVQLAWGDQPPQRGGARFGWLEAPDLALFCHLRDYYLRIYGQEKWDSLRVGTYEKLVGEKPVFENGKCLNCAYRKRASEVFSAEDLWALSIFSVRCEQYR
jgi:hypothetical protein